MIERFLRRVLCCSWALSVIGGGVSLAAAPPEPDVAPVVGPSVNPQDPVFVFGRALHATPEAIGLEGIDMELGGWLEPAIALNPNDPLNIAVMSRFEVRVSTDGGITWQAPVPLQAPVNHVVAADPALAFDADGRLFASYLANAVGVFAESVGTDILLAQCDPATGAFLPGYPVDVTAQIGLPATAGNSQDKEWLASDSHGGSPFANRLYLTWTKLPGDGNEVTLTSYSSDHGITWSPPLQLGDATGFVWPSHITVAPNGDVYVADHRQPVFSGGAPNGVSGHIAVFRSTNGGVTFDQMSDAFPPGSADMTFNVQSLASSRIPGARFWLEGSVQPWVLADPNVPGRIYVIANDDPDNDVTAGDAADVFIVISENGGVTWSAPKRVDHGPGSTFQVMPTAGIDPLTGYIVVYYYDNRSGALNADGDYLLDVYATASIDGGLTFAEDVPINDLPFDPDASAPCRLGCGPFLSGVHANGTSAFAVGVDGSLLAYEAGSWSSADTTGVPTFAVWSSSPNDSFLCGVGGNIFHYNGHNLSSQTSGTTATLVALDGRSNGDLYIAGEAGTVLHYDGSNWSPLAAPTAADLHGVWVNPTGSAFFAGRDGTVLRYDGAWTDLSVPGQPNLYNISGASDDDVYVGSLSNGLLHWDGTGWSPIDTGLLNVAGVWEDTPSDVIATATGRIRRYDGSTWLPEDTGENLLFQVHGSAAADVFAVGTNAETVHHDGVGWAQQDNPLKPTTPTLRIGEYNGVAVGGGRAFAAWCGNTSANGQPVDQQVVFDSFSVLGPGEAGVTAPLQVSRSGGLLTFTWGAPGCSSATYGLYRGDLNTLRTVGYSHDVALACAQGTTSLSISEDDPNLGSADYFLVVASTGPEEGSYGRDGAGLERPRSAAACATGQNLNPCGP